MKRVTIIDEYGVPWVYLPGEAIFDNVAKTKLHESDLAAWRDHLFNGLNKELFDEAQERLKEIGDQCLNAQEPDETLIRQLSFAAAAFTLYHSIAGQTE